MPEALKISAYTPDKQLKTTSISLRKYTKEQAEEVAKGWREATQAGLPYTRPVFPRDKMTVGEPFERKDISDIVGTLPTNGGISFAVIGSTRSGKSVMMCHLYQKYFKKHITILMTLSSQADIYGPMKKKAIISEGYNKQFIKQPMKLNHETNNKYNFCLIFDDLAMDGKNDMEMTRLLTVGRNSGMSAVICGQRLQMLNATGRANVNYICLFKQNTDTAVEDTIKTYLRSYFPSSLSIPEMCNMYKEMTQDHNFFCIDTLNDKCYVSKIKNVGV